MGGSFITEDGECGEGDALDEAIQDGDFINGAAGSQTTTR
jgi:hypothetical protein